MVSWNIRFRKAHPKSSPSSAGPPAGLLPPEEPGLLGWLNQMALVEPVFAAVHAVVDASNTRETLVAVQAFPELLTDRGTAAMAMAEQFAEATGSFALLRSIREQQAWLEHLRDAAVDLGRIELPDA
ncbi:hypothetical protein OG401_35510 [Kitasatospora purpeofusca]|uniref:hypothetical protein n=1 Tax=Kitasatospora purpeofusca TaxID=67352 RepID=UPI0022502278|nr:hypothetical protein [Kitasatospora purpeofusca]MCX4689544.1 hypothetical protein [Kitasatospora purpeofusca]